MSSSKAASRYSSFDSQSSITSSTELKRPKSSFLRNTNNEACRARSNDCAIVKVKHEHNFGAMVKKFMEKRSNSSSAPKLKPVRGDRALPLIVPANFIAEDLKKTAKKGSSNFSSLPKKLFGKGNGNGKTSEVKAKALTEVKANTRTLGMVLRSERELLSLNKDQESDIAELKSLLHERTTEVEKLKDLCLKQREEIQALKSAILFPSEMDSQLQELLDEQGSELKQAKRVIPSLQKQISSLTGQLQCLSEDLAEVKAAKYTTRSSDDSFSRPRTPVYDQEEDANSLDFSSDDPTMSDSPDNMLLDVNPCLTPCYSRTKFKEYKAETHNYRKDEPFHEGNVAARKLSRSSGHFTIPGPETETFCRSDEGKSRCRKPIKRHIL